MANTLCFHQPAVHNFAQGNMYGNPSPIQDLQRYNYSADTTYGYTVPLPNSASNYQTDCRYNYNNSASSMHHTYNGFTGTTSMGENLNSLNAVGSNNWLRSNTGTVAQNAHYSNYHYPPHYSMVPSGWLAQGTNTINSSRLVPNSDQTSAASSCAVQKMEQVPVGLINNDCDIVVRRRWNSSQRKVHHPCPIQGCDKKYRKTSHLKAHIRKHAGVRPYVCSWVYCLKSFTRNDELNRHLRVHTGEKNYVCLECTKRFSRSDHLSKHLKMHERNRLSSSVPPSPTTSDIDVTSDANNSNTEILSDKTIQS